MADGSIDLRGRLARTADVLRDDRRGRVLVAVAFGWLLALGIRLVFPAVLPAVRSEFGMDLSTAGTLLSALWVAYAAMQFPGGVLADRVGERNVLVASVAVASVGVLGVATATTVGPFFAATVLVGLGVGLYGTTRITVLSDTFPEHSGTAIGVNQAAGNVGTTLLPPLAGFLAVWIGWRWSFRVILPGFLLVAAGLWLWVPNRTSPSAALSGGTSVRYVLRSLAAPRVVAATLAMAALSFVYQAFTGFYPTYLVAEKGLGSGAAATLLGVFFGAAVVIQPIAGAVGDRAGARTMLVAVVVTTGAVLVALTRLEGRLPLLGLTLLASVQLSVWPIANAYVVDVVPDDIQGTTVGLTRTFYLGVGAAGPVFVGVVAEGGQFDAAFLALAGVALAASLPTLLLSPSQ